MHDKFVTKVSVVGAKAPSTCGLAISTKNVSEKQSIGKKIEDIDKKLPKTSGLVKRLIIKEKLQKLKLRYLVLLV